MTWDEVKDFIDQLPTERKSDTATIYAGDWGEYFGVVDVAYAQETDVLDKGHAFLQIGQVT